MHDHASDWQKQHPYEPAPDSHPQPVPLVSASDLVNPMLRASDLAEKGVRVCDPKLPLMEAIGMLAQAESGLLPVISKGKPIGVLTERGVVAALARSPNECFRLMAEHVMGRSFAQVRDDARLDSLLDNFGTRGTIVVDRRGQFVGIIYWRSLAGELSERGLGRVLMRLLEREKKEGQR